MSTTTVPVARLAAPFTLTTFRLLLGPGLLLLIPCQPPRGLFAVLVGLAFLSDWLDGVVARRLGVARPWLRRYDVVADLVFYLSALAAACWLEPTLLGDHAVPIAGLLMLEVVCQIVHWARFRCMIATHAYLCKAWSVVLALMLAVLLGWGESGRPLLVLAIVVGYVAYLDVILILVVARRVPVDVISAYHVWRDERSEGRPA